jgi:hypothetical protein
MPLFRLTIRPLLVYVAGLVFLLAVLGAFGVLIAGLQNGFSSDALLEFYDKARPTVLAASALYLVWAVTSWLRALLKVRQRAREAGISLKEFSTSSLDEQSRVMRDAGER